MINIHILGIDHRVQWNKNDPAYQAYIRSLEECVKKYEIKVIAEEWNEQASEINSVKKSTTKEFAEENNIELVYIEPIIDIKNRNQQMKKLKDNIMHELNISSNQPITEEMAKMLIKRHIIASIKYRQLVEIEWYKKIKNRLSEQLLFIVGKEHVNPTNLLMWSSVGIRPEDLPHSLVFGINKLLESKNILHHVIEDNIFPKYLQSYVSDYNEAVKTARLLRRIG